MLQVIKRFQTKVYSSSLSAIHDITSGSSISVGGFGLCGIPENLIRALSSRSKVVNLALYSLVSGTSTHGIGQLISNKQVSHLTAAYIGGNQEATSQYFKGDLRITFTPMGTLVEQLRSGGAGLLGFYTQTGVGTVVELGGFPEKYFKNEPKVQIRSIPKETRVHNGVKYLFEESIKTDFSFVKAWKADPMGNLVFRKTARNSNQDLPGSAKVTIAEVEEIVGIGELDPNEVQVPGVLVQRVVKGERYDKVIENLTLHTGDTYNLPGTPEQQKIREKIARRAAKEVRNGMVVNLGIGIPTLIPCYLPEGVEVSLHSENGLIGMGPYPHPGEEDADLINAGKETITLLPGSSLFSSSTSFGIIRGGHLGLTCVGALQVSETGDFSSWIVPGKLVRGMGGAMDLASSGTQLVVCMEHTSRGSAKILDRCTLPLTGHEQVSLLITDLAVFKFSDSKMILTEISPSSNLDEVKSKTSGHFSISSSLKPIDY